MANRKPISKKTRFEVFKRDSFMCQYCGSTPPGVVLHVDHILPVALGGENNLDNLLTSCSNCNLGKGATPLSSANPSFSMADKAKEIKEREEQVRAYSDMILEKAERLDRDAWSVVCVLECNEDADCYNRKDFASIKMFVEKFPVALVIHAAKLSLERMPYGGRKQFLYFCGVCWNMIREANHGES